MNGSASAFISQLLIILLVAYRSEGDPRSQIIKLTCDQQLANNQTKYYSNFIQSMEQIGTQMGTSGRGTAITGTGIDSNYALAECYGDLSAEDCILCYAEARRNISTCYNGGQLFLDGCFMRAQNYNFFQEYAGPNDTVICGNTTTSDVFRDSARRAISDAVRDAPKNTQKFARQLAVSDASNESAYVLAQCWRTISQSSCTDCLDNAFSWILKCFPNSEGRALRTGCFLRYSNTNFLNPEPTQGNNGEGNGVTKLIQSSCGNTRATTTSFIPLFVQAMEILSSRINASRFGTVVEGTETDDKFYGLAQCFGDISTNECLICYTVARTVIPNCLPNTGGRVYLNGCFLRYENYNFFKEYGMQQDKSICPNNTRRNNAFQQSVWKAVSQAVETAPRSKNYHARTQDIISGTGNNSVFAVADCLFTLDADSCADCLRKAAKSMLDCLPASEGYAAYTGCFMSYSESSSLYADDTRLSKGKVMAMAVSSSVAFLVVSVIAFYAWKRASQSKRKGSDDDKLLKLLNNSSLNVKYSTVEKATGSFDDANKLGQGGFGTVYKGVLPDKREIAVKRLFFNHRQRARDFYNEVNIISSVDHKNLVKLVGFSCLGPESILIYEYLPNRSLDHFIFDAVRGKELNWAKRFDIIVGIAEGLAYLHENSKTRIIHRDIKAANILLDSKFRAKIADFGLARSYQEDKNHISTGIAGTLGYMAPEYIAHGQLTEKVDVYSFGVLILEVVSGIRNRGMQNTHNLISIAWNHFKHGSVEELFDTKLMLNNQTSNTMKKEIQSVVHIGLLCIQEVASLRPTMSMAIQMLSKNIEPLPLPANPPYIPETNIHLNDAFRLSINTPVSVPTVSNSSFIPR